MGPGLHFTVIQTVWHLHLIGRNNANFAAIKQRRIWRKQANAATGLMISPGNFTYGNIALRRQHKDTL